MLHHKLNENVARITSPLGSLGTENLTLTVRHADNTEKSLLMDKHSGWGGISSNPKFFYAMETGTADFKPKSKLSQRPIITKVNISRSQWELKLNTCILPHLDQARENASDQVAIGFSFASDWLKRWREFSRLITERREAKQM